MGSTKAMVIPTGRLCRFASMGTWRDWLPSFDPVQVQVDRAHAACGFRQVKSSAWLCPV